MTEDSDNASEAEEEKLEPIAETTNDSLNESKTSDGSSTVNNDAASSVDLEDTNRPMDCKWGGAYSEMQFHHAMLFFY